MKRPTPNQNESPFGFDELFFSTTNNRGVITFGNDVFVRVSGYPRETLKGAPHSIIRHPDMPRAVFKLLWDTLLAGRPIAAYVKNLSANGSYYWVYAFVFPIKDGYLSIRLKPSSPIFSVVKDLYTATLAVEEKEGMEGSVPFILDQVQKAGFRDYTDFMIQAAFAEINALPDRDVERKSGSVGVIADISNISSKTSKDLKDCFKRVQDFQNINKSLVTTMEHLTSGFTQLKFNALNMTVAAAKFGEVASSLGVVAKEFSDLSEQIRSHLSGLEHFEQNLTETIQKCTLKIVSMDVQMMMVDFFIKESIQKSQHAENAFSDMLIVRDNFASLFRGNSHELTVEIKALAEQLSKISSQLADVKRFTTGLEVIRQIGAVESARVNEVKVTFVHYLEEMLRFINLLQSSNSSIQKAAQELNSHCDAIDHKVSSVAGHVDTLFEKAASLSPQTKELAI
nr:hypothetical protein CKG001_23240 [Bdellovibrio sp. CKG001]